ncbi:hypothetical protein ABZ904_13530 [Streptomyces sp. NPDC046900]|uniref:hypothetical protein n=1 Tax=Streptomyces sp. NPDC046900 TaxID=3155473 RepID=UPI0033DC1AB6
MRLRPTAAWAGVTVAALMVTAACGTEGAKTAAKAVDNADMTVAALARATDRTEDVGSAQVGRTTERSGSGPISLDGTYSWGHGLAFDVMMDTKAVRAPGDRPAAPKTHTVFVDGAYYYDIGPRPSGPLKGKEWMKIDASAVFGDKGAQAFQGNSAAGNPRVRSPWTSGSCQGLPGPDEAAVRQCDGDDGLREVRRHGRDQGPARRTDR